MTAEGQDFRDIYARVATLVTEQAADRNKGRPPLRDPSVAHVSVVDVPRATLLAIEEDESFIASCYLLLLDTAPSARQMRPRLRWLGEGTMTREEIIDQILASRTFANRGRRVNIT